jgi:hypothetical protein
MTVTNTLYHSIETMQSVCHSAAVFLAVSVSEPDVDAVQLVPSVEAPGQEGHELVLPVALPSPQQGRIGAADADVIYYLKGNGESHNKLLKQINT